MYIRYSRLIRHFLIFLLTGILLCCSSKEFNSVENHTYRIKLNENIQIIEESESNIVFSISNIALKYTEIFSADECIFIEGTLPPLRKSIIRKVSLNTGKEQTGYLSYDFHDIYDIIRIEKGYLVLGKVGNDSMEKLICILLGEDLSVHWEKSFTDLNENQSRKLLEFTKIGTSEISLSFGELIPSDSIQTEARLLENVKFDTMGNILHHFRIPIKKYRSILTAISDKDGICILSRDHSHSDVNIERRDNSGKIQWEKRLTGENQSVGEIITSKNREYHYVNSLNSGIEYLSFGMSGEEILKKVISKSPSQNSKTLHILDFWGLDTGSLVLYEFGSYYNSPLPRYLVKYDGKANEEWLCQISGKDYEFLNSYSAYFNKLGEIVIFGKLREYKRKKISNYIFCFDDTGADFHHYLLPEKYDDYSIESISLNGEDITTVLYDKKELLILTIKLE